MFKDIFELARTASGKSNPIVTALLYSFCPAAAHWYVRNVQAEDIFDITWKAFEDYETGRTMTECLKGYGLGTLIPDVITYIDQVSNFRSRHTALGMAPELSPLFQGDRAGQSTFNLRHELNNLGGSWKSLLSYVRVWAFLMKDWRSQMKIPSGAQVTRVFKKFTVALSAPGDYSRSKAHFPVWGWDVTIGKVRSIYLGLLVSSQRQDALRFALVYNSDLVGDKGWPGQRPYLFSLDRDTGSASHINLAHEHNDVLTTVLKIYEVARVGPNFPLTSFRDKEACISCGYKKTCYGNDGNTFLSTAMHQLIHENKRERDLLTGYRRTAEHTTSGNS